MLYYNDYISKNPLCLALQSMYATKNWLDMQLVKKKYNTPFVYNTYTFRNIYGQC